MVTIEEYVRCQNECSVLLESLDTAVSHASRLIGFTDVLNEDDNGNVIELRPYASDHFEDLVKTARQISSYSDRLINKLALLKNAIQHVSDAQRDVWNVRNVRNEFYSALKNLLLSFTRPVKNEDGTVLPNRLVSVTIDDQYKRTCDDVVDVYVSSFHKSDPHLFMIKLFDSNSRINVIYSNKTILQYDICNVDDAAKSVVDCILSRM